MTADVDAMEEVEEMIFTAATDDDADAECVDIGEQGKHLDAMDREQLQQHIQGLQQKLARQKARQGLVAISEEQQQQLVKLLDAQRERDGLADDLKDLVTRATELNQQSEVIHQEIHGLNIVSENATNKCAEITYGAQYVIDQNEKLQKTLNERLEQAVQLNEQCESLAETLNRSIERTELTQQKMDSATDRSQSANQKSRLLLEELEQSKSDINEQVTLVHQITELCNRTNSESEVLHKELGLLGEQLRANMAAHQEQLAVNTKLQGNCQRLADEVSETKSENQNLLNEVTDNNSESKDLIGKMSKALKAVSSKLAQNRALNLDLQHSLQRNQQQREELMVLTSECREIRDQSVESQKKNEAMIKESLEKVSVAQAENRQGKLQIESALKEVYEGNKESRELIERMSELTASSLSTQEENIELNDKLQGLVQESTLTRDELVELVESSRVARDKTEAVLETSVKVNEDAQASISSLNNYMDCMRATRDELKDLIGTSRKSHEEATESLEAMRTNINNSTMIQKECMRVNKESVAATLESKRTTEKLAEELESSARLNETYQDRMKAAEQKYQAAVEAERKYQDKYEAALDALQKNELLLEEARATMKQYADNSQEYNNTIKQFQQTTLQSQQIILESQTSIKTLIAKNEQLEEENRFLKTSQRRGEPMAPNQVWPDINAGLGPDDNALGDSFDKSTGQFAQFK